MPRWFNWLRPEQIYDAYRISDVGGQPALVAAATPIDLARVQLTPKFESWQAEAWKFYDDLGEFRYAVDWRAEMVSRVRLRAGRLVPGTDEPELLDDGPAVDLLKSLTDGAAGGAEQLMRGFATQLGVSGECWLTGETVDPTTDIWRVRSSEEIRTSRVRDAKWEVIDDVRSSGGQEYWKPLPADALVTRVWEPHPRKFHRADSPARAARPVLRELELVNRHIQAQYLSRLASAGLILIPSEISFPVRAEYAEAADPFTMEWIEAAKQAIRTPGTAAAAVPIPLRGAAEYLDKIRFIDFTITADATILAKRDSSIRRLATQLDLPAEILLGMGDVNHWSAWQIEESGVKVHILPMVERICNALLVGYMQPRLKAANEYDPEIVVWYDASEITMRPDRSDAAILVYDKLELSGEALRRETGFDETDKPTSQELEEQILLKLALDPASAATALKELTGLELEPMSTTPVAEDPGVGDPQASPDATGQQNGPPDTQTAPPPAPDQQKAAAMGDVLAFQVSEAKKLQAGYRHWLVRDMTGFQITHPASCSDLATRCPYTSEIPPAAVPGRSGTYEVELVNGRLRVGALRQDSAYAHQRP